jgi:hypothetical protein
VSDHDGTSHDDAMRDIVRDDTVTAATGHPQVDEVLQALETLDDLPVDQHVAVFEAAHVGLRDALKDARPAAPAHG